MSSDASITQSQLESYLWGAATLLRGLIDAGDYKQFIFPLLFFKRTCDAYDEESAKLREELGAEVDEQYFPEIHRFKIPRGAHWRDVRETTTHVGKAIQDAMRAIEQANPQLYGIFGDAPWTNTARLPDRTLSDLVEHFSTLTLSVANVSEDLLGQAYEYLIKKFADDSGHTAAEFYTNRTVVHLMTQLVDPQPGESVYDPTCGSGGMLLSCVEELKRQGKEYRNLQLYGQELNLITSSIARTNLFLHGIEDFQIERGDTLARPAILEGDHLRRFDVVLANPPYSIKQWDQAAWASDPYGRNLYGVPPQGRADYAFFQHIIASLKPETGRCAILFPHGVLFRQDEQAMRAAMVEDDVIDAVIGLGPNLFYNSPMESCVVVCRRQKPPERQGKVLFINAIDEVTREQAQSFLGREHIERIVNTYRDFVDVDHFAKVVGKCEILDKQANLSISRYVDGFGNHVNEMSEALSLDEVLDQWQSSSRALHQSMDDLISTLESIQAGVV